MTSGDFQPLSQVPPPTEFSGIPDTPSKWPTVIGVIGIILASLGLFGGCCGVAYPWLWPFYLDFLSNQPNITQDQIDQIVASQPPVWWMLVGGIMGLILAIWLLVASINLLRRRRRAVSATVAWAIVQIVWGFTSVGINVYLQLSSPAGSDPTQALGSGFGMCCGLMIGVAWPAFVLIWLLRAKTKADTSTWM
ncbi:MAG: hypothetical protein L0219_07585 [Phycisphaerales bacterium]|nr:hypothetical protein [Phycisphaerales bacterium]